MNWRAIQTLYISEMARTGRTLGQSVISPVISTCLYFVVFGSAIGSRISEVQGVSYGAFIVPGLIMLSLMTQGISNASFAIYFPKFIGTVYELLSAPVSFVEIVTSYVGAAATKSAMLGLIILATSTLFVSIHIAHLGGTFYSLDMLPPFWQKVTLINPVVYLVSGFRWSFYNTADVSVGLSLLMVCLFLSVCIGVVAWIFKTGYRLKS